MGLNNCNLSSCTCKDYNFKAQFICSIEKGIQDYSIRGHNTMSCWRKWIP